jgi:hypothetical protein
VPRWYGRGASKGRRGSCAPSFSSCEHDVILYQYRAQKRLRLHQPVELDVSRGYDSQQPLVDPARAQSPKLRRQRDLHRSKRVASGIGAETRG